MTRIIMMLTLLLGLPATSAGNPEASGLTVETATDLRSRLSSAEAAVKSGRTAEAAALFNDAIDDAIRLNQRGLLLARALDGLAELEFTAKRLSEAESLYLRSIPLFRELLGPDQPRLAVSLHNLGVLHLEQQRYEPAANELKEALDIWVKLYGSESSQARNTRRAFQRTSSGASSE
jgi:tetratricopeptide (TPR) repeat protein